MNFSLKLKRKENTIEQLFIDLIENNKNNFYKIAYSYLKNEADALEVIQESVYKGYISLNSVKEKKHLKTWFTRILINNSITAINKQKKVVSLDENVIENTIEINERGLEDNLDLEKAMSMLSSHEKSIVILRYFEDMKLDDISDILNQPVSTIKSILYRSLKKLKINLEEDEIYEK